MSKGERQPELQQVVRVSNRWEAVWLAESGGERAAVQTLREVRMRWANAVASGLRWLQHRFGGRERREGYFA